MMGLHGSAIATCRFVSRQLRDSFYCRVQVLPNYMMVSATNGCHLAHLHCTGRGGQSRAE